MFWTNLIDIVLEVQIILHSLDYRGLVSLKTWEHLIFCHSYITGSSKNNACNKRDHEPRKENIDPNTHFLLYMSLCRLTRESNLSCTPNWVCWEVGFSSSSFIWSNSSACSTKSTFLLRLASGYWDQNQMNILRWMSTEYHRLKKLILSGIPDIKHSIIYI